MSTIGKLLGRSPFGPLQRHMEQVADCVGKMEQALAALEEHRWEDIASLAEATSRQEHSADQLKDDIRNQIVRRFFLPIDRGQFLEILAVQDSLADSAEDVTALLTFRKLSIPAEFLDDFREFCQCNCKAFYQAQQIVEQLDELFESGFGGAEAEKNTSNGWRRRLHGNTKPTSFNAISCGKSSAKSRL